MQIPWANILSWQSLANLIDILVVWYVIYKLIMLIRGTKAVQLVKGIAVIIVVKLVSALLHLTTISFLMDQILTWGVIALVIVFQPEIRRGLEHLGRGALLRRAGQDQNRIAQRMINELDKAIQYMAKRRIGALISIQMHTGLEDYIETGIPLDADISGELLINIFIPNTPLHDGAVIVRDNRIAVAAAYLPLSESNTIPKELGTRHRAAVGISEVTDALTIVVSEETGGVTLTKNSQLMRDMSQDEYLKYLRSQFIVEDKEPNQWDKIRERVLRFFASNGGDHHVD
ncbi:diadenylate cyclase CdaA [Schleiferilactobacillus perolens]|jgi:diadenylate cyclase|uniref:diadenylate cyclase CdaA n=1 Tax=Schleiferilactobacillus perolens TaxID=100468 RepID=UPI0023576870|nr:diadenylate cyclase CdaA [Schleiferilactobacillus perolens]MCI1891319.1 diadenylate cyclase CdaA [Schleiferilactobacillus harbinensis]MCI1913941.1 diadenylate cyclase CdaA [Schleiferilactobacillus harbinensis]MCI2170180.1 diadenylate cyclase CdaA [Schleiferilactobacillus perolens]